MSHDYRSREIATNVQAETATDDAVIYVLKYSWFIEAMDILREIRMREIFLKNNSQEKQQTCEIWSTLLCSKRKTLRMDYSLTFTHSSITIFLCVITNDIPISHILFSVLFVLRHANIK